MTPSEFCAYMRGLFNFVDAGRKDVSKPMGFRAEQVKLIRSELEKVKYDEPKSEPTKA